MLPELPYQIVSVTADLILFIFVVYYLIDLHSRDQKVKEKEKELEKREVKIDSNYHQIVDNALNKERKILDDAAAEADEIITDAEYVNRANKEVVDKALQKISTDIQKETVTTGNQFSNSYQTSLSQIADISIKDFHQVIKELETNLQKQTKEFNEKLLPELQKELDEYKKARMALVDEAVVKAVQKASQELFNKSLSVDDHQKLLIDALEKAKKEGVFN